VIEYLENVVRSDPNVHIKDIRAIWDYWEAKRSNENVFMQRRFNSVMREIYNRLSLPNKTYVFGPANIVPQVTEENNMGEPRHVGKPPNPTNRIVEPFLPKPPEWLGVRVVLPSGALIMTDEFKSVIGDSLSSTIADLLVQALFYEKVLGSITNAAKIGSELASILNDLYKKNPDAFGIKHNNNNDGNAFDDFISYLQQGRINDALNSVAGTPFGGAINKTYLETAVSTGRLVVPFQFVSIGGNFEQPLGENYVLVISTEAIAGFLADYKPTLSATGLGYGQVNYSLELNREKATAFGGELDVAVHKKFNGLSFYLEGGFRKPFVGEWDSSYGILRTGYIDKSGKFQILGSIPLYSAMELELGTDGRVKAVGQASAGVGSIGGVPILVSIRGDVVLKQGTIFQPGAAVRPGFIGQLTKNKQLMLYGSVDFSDLETVQDIMKVVQPGLRIGAGMGVRAEIGKLGMGEFGVELSEQTNSIPGVGKELLATGLYIRFLGPPKK